MKRTESSDDRNQLAPHMHPEGDDEMPSWVHSAMAAETLSQPWKSEFGIEEDPAFGEGEDILALYNEGIAACPGEGSLAA
ncbi:hypothetical protein N7509_004898 [Penicillium cosmopolitanum]|uniref:Uncharacterized protein n=1 Tax=Penicillium cosmopolitanum TaxID=1131564 RepID=A0A9W9W164_9EURO|nr:uncharacterized protein N7509_004898 [Penicillium cosmopolitanum]KAJ5396785.1 hypothetical protein N7509_004898 [Penicillium cosmopolitanum]